MLQLQTDVVFSCCAKTLIRWLRGCPVILGRTSSFAVIACHALATAAAPAPTAPTDSEIRALLQANGTWDVGTQIGPIAAQQLNVALHRSNPNLPTRADAVVMEVVMSYLRTHAAQDHVADRLVLIYAKYLTRDDVRQMTEFYRSPVGRKLVSMTPAISLESARIGQEWMESILPGLQSQLLSRLKEEKLVN